MNIQIRKFYEAEEGGGTVDWCKSYMSLQKQFEEYKLQSPSLPASGGDGLREALTMFKNYFAEHDKTTHEHHLYFLADKYLKDLLSSSPVPVDVREVASYPGSDYQRLFNAISDTKGIPLVSQMQEIIDIVHQDFKINNNEK